MNRSFLRFKRSNTRGLPALVVAALVFVSSCATTPPGGGVFDVGGWAVSGQSLQVRIDARALKQVQELGSVTPSVASLFDRVQTLWVGLPDPVLSEKSQLLSGVRVGVSGRFPPAETAWILFWNRPPVPWTVVQPQENALLVARTAIALEPTPPTLTLADGPSEWGHDDVRLVWDHPGPSLLGPLAARFVDLRRLVLELSANDATLQGQVLLELPDDRSASAAVVLLRLFGSDLQAQWNQDLEWHAEGNQVVGEPVLFSSRNLVNLLTNLTRTESP